MSLRAILLLGASALLWLGCPAVLQTPEEKIRSMVSEVEKAARAKDAFGVEAHVSKDYADDLGRNRAQIRDLIRIQFNRRGKLFIVSRVRGIEFSDAKNAKLEVLVGWADVEVPDFRALQKLEASIYVFDLDVREEEEDVWRVTRASWHRASADELL